MPETEPFALVGKGAHGLRITAVNPAAAAAGVAIGAALPDVRAAVPALVVRPAETANDAGALLAFTRWLGRYGPSMNVDGTDGAWVDITGVAHLFGSETRLCADLARRLGHLGIVARIGLADTLGASHALARFGAAPFEKPWVIAVAGETKAALHDLPVAALRLAPDAVHLLMRLGLKRIGQLYGVPRVALATRFREGTRKGGRAAADVTAAELLLRLDQALGLVREPRAPLEPPPRALSRLAFPEPLCTGEGVEQALRWLAEDLAQSLAGQAMGARRFRLALYRADGTAADIVVGTRRSGRDPSHLCRLLTERLAGIDAGFGIDVMTMEARHLEPLGAIQVGLEAAETERAGDASELIDRLVGRLGSRRVCVWADAASHIPERAGIWRPAMNPQMGNKSRLDAVTPAVEGQQLRTAYPVSRPPLLLSPPEPIAVIAEIPEGAPLHFVWRRVRRRIVRSEGPERIAPEWWRHIETPGALGGTRDYYRLEDATGARFWVFREGLYVDAEGASNRDTDDATAGETDTDTTPRWFVHGLFG